ncbi:Arc family DNA-binding protein [Candidatus Viadribacter manganicus]|uniref:Arc-like DNA binding domain-containing protein n=1 Tax=Candidatus Viadribacter manganicus TaxID=1759059 RepID=A0A1B1AKD2_9PROT|nr:Arc family DNA-binding protein [Candidatus Viadribacter manganicus]ANP47017.1 hypothetical protein ATE48_14380 [Candidatus Viadribacter manganicus]
MASERKAFALRLDPALHDAIARLANAELRSVNAEIEFLLREALRARGVKLNATEQKNNDGAGGDGQ